MRAPGEIRRPFFMLFEFEVFMSSNAWEVPSVWSNSYKINVTADTPGPGTLADYLLQSHAAIHRQHVRIDRCAYWKIKDELDGETAFPPAIPPNELEETLVIQPLESYRFGAVPGAGLGAHELALRVSRDVARGRRGTQFYRGILELSDVRGYPENEAALKDVQHFRTLWNDAFWLHFPPGPGLFFIERSGASMARFGEFNQTLDFTVRGVTLPRGIDRARARVPEFRKRFNTTIMGAVDIVSAIRHELRLSLFYDGDFVPLAMRDRAIQLLAAGYGAATAAMQAVATNNDEEIKEFPAYVGKGGVTGEAILGMGGIFAAGKPASLAPSEQFINVNQTLGGMEPEIDHPSGSFFSQQQLRHIIDQIEPFMFAAFFMVRGVYLYPKPRGLDSGVPL